MINKYRTVISKQTAFYEIINKVVNTYKDLTDFFRMSFPNDSDKFNISE